MALGQFFCQKIACTFVTGMPMGRVLAKDLSVPG